MAIGAVFSPNFRLGVTQTWNASVEQQLSRYIALHLAYVGNQTYHQTTIVDLNPSIYANGSNRTTYPVFSSIMQSNEEGTASYQSLQAGITTQPVHGIKFDSHFTWSKNLSLSDSGNLSPTMVVWAIHSPTLRTSSGTTGYPR